jgi:hypothetical protein
MSVLGEKPPIAMMKYHRRFARCSVIGTAATRPESSVSSSRIACPAIRVKAVVRLGEDEYGNAVSH